MAVGTLLERITDYANRPDPYPLYAELREAGVARQTDGSYLVGGYYDIVALFHNPRLSSDRRNRAGTYSGLPAEEEEPHPFIRLDDPEHHRLRSLATRPFGPPHSPGRIDAMRDEITRITDELIESLQGRTRVDIVDDFAYPCPSPSSADSSVYRAKTSRPSASGPTPSPTPATSGPAKTSPCANRPATRPERRWATTWWTSPNSAAATRVTTCCPRSSATPPRPEDSPARNWRPPQYCCSSPDTKPRSI